MSVCTNFAKGKLNAKCCAHIRKRQHRLHVNFFPLQYTQPIFCTTAARFTKDYIFQIGGGAGGKTYNAAGIPKIKFPLGRADAPL